MAGPSGEAADAGAADYPAAAALRGVRGHRLSPSLVGLLVTAVFAASYALLGALAGLTLGVKMPVLTWTDQLMPIKQSAPVMLTLFGGMGYTILLFAGFLLLPGWRLGFAGYAACFAAANLLLCAVLHRWLRKKGRGAVCRPVTEPVPGLTFPEELL